MNAPTEFTPEVLEQRQREVVQALMAVLPTHCLLYRDEDTAPYECDGLAAYRRLPLAVALPETEAQVQRVVQICQRLDVPIVAARRGHRPVGRRDADPARRRAVARALPQDRRSRSVCAHRDRAAGRAQSRDLRSRRALRPLLRARSVVADRLHDRRQRRRELGRRALPEVRPHRAQRAARARRDDGRRRRRVRLARARRARARPARGADRQRRHVRDRHRGHRQADPEAADGAGHHGELRRRRERRRRGRRDHRGRHHPGRPRDDGQARHARRRGIRARRLRPRRRRDPAVRIGRHARRSRRGNRAHDGGAARTRRDAASRFRARRAERLQVLVRAQERVSGGGPHLARLLLHGRHHPAPQHRAAARAHRGDGKEVRRCAASTCSTPATATCIR